MRRQSDTEGRGTSSLGCTTTTTHRIWWRWGNPVPSCFPSVVSPTGHEVPNIYRESSLACRYCPPRPGYGKNAYCRKSAGLSWKKNRLRGLLQRSTHGKYRRANKHAAHGGTYPSGISISNPPVTERPAGTVEGLSEEDSSVPEASSDPSLSALLSPNSARCRIVKPS